MWAPQLDAASIVMVGSFNPAIFQPRWLGSLKLIRPEEAESAKITTIQAELADFSTEWFQLQVIQHRLMLTSSDPTYYSPLRDLAVAMFAVLPHTPIKALGLNRMLHFEMRTSEAWHGIGHLLAPKQPWDPILKTPGLRSMTMEGYRREGSGGTLHVKIEPSRLTQPGLYIEVNEEFTAPKDDQPDSAHWVPGCLGEHWDGMMGMAGDTAQHLLGLVKS